MKGGHEFLSVFSLIILSVIRKSLKADIKQLTEKTGLEKYRVKAALERLIEGGYITAPVGGKSIYSLTSKTIKALGINAAKPQASDKKASMERILKLVGQNKTVTRGDVVDLLGVTPPQAYRLLAALVENGKLALSGNKKSAVYTFVEGNV
jgi:ATP-dependent DNA helicase RecG